MSKITFRADDELVARLESLDTSKSEVMRRALRHYLDTESDSSASQPSPERMVTDDESDSSVIDDHLEERIDRLVADRLDQHSSVGRTDRQDVHITLSIEDDHTISRRVVETTSGDDRRNTSPRSASRSCARCGETVGPDHIHCPNCGEKAANRIFCECGDELRTDWSFCPGCGRRTPAADVLDRD